MSSSPHRPLYTEEYISYVIQHSSGMTPAVWSQIPLDVLDNIGGQLAGLILDPETPHRNTVKLCPGTISAACITCKTWVVACRRIWFRAETSISLRTIEDIHQLRVILQHPLPVDLPTLFTRINLDLDGGIARSLDKRWAWSIASLMRHLPSLKGIVLSKDDLSPLFWDFRPHYPDFRHIHLLVLYNCRFHSFSVFARQIRALSHLSLLVCGGVRFLVGEPPLQIPSRIPVGKNFIRMAVAGCDIRWPFVYLLAAPAFRPCDTGVQPLALDGRVRAESDLFIIPKMVKLLEQSNDIDWKPRVFWVREIGDETRLLVTSDENKLDLLNLHTLDLENENLSEHDIFFSIKYHGNTSAMDVIHATDTGYFSLCRISIYYSYVHAVGWKALNQMLSPILQPFSLEVIYPTSFSGTESSRLERQIRSRMRDVKVFLTPADLPKLRLPPNPDDASDSAGEQGIESDDDEQDGKGSVLGEREQDEGGEGQDEQGHSEKQSRQGAGYDKERERVENVCACASG